MYQIKIPLLHKHRMMFTTYCASKTGIAGHNLQNIAKYSVQGCSGATRLVSRQQMVLCGMKNAIYRYVLYIAKVSHTS